MIYEEQDPGFFVKLGVTQSDAFVLIEASDHETSEIWLLDRADASASPRLVEPRTPQLKYDVEHHGDEPDHPDQRRRLRGFQDRHRACGNAGTRLTGKISCPTGPAR